MTLRLKIGLILTFIITATLSLYPHPTNGQSDTQSQNRLNRIFQGEESAFNEYFFIDELGIELATQSSPLEESIDPSTYQLGPYDLISIESEGSVAFRLRGVSINSQGDVVLPSIGRVNLQNLTIAESQNKIEEAYQENFENIEIELTLDKPRLQVVHITGEINRTGKYVVPAGTRVSNLLERAVGPISEMGSQQQQRPGVNQPQGLPGQTNGQSSQSFDTETFLSSQGGQNKTGPGFPDSTQLDRDKFNLRNIHIKRNDSTYLTADLISYYKAGRLKANPYLKNGDVITIKRRLNSTPRVSISGAVLSPREVVYNKEDDISTLIGIGGGFSSDADSTKAIIYHDNGKKEEISLNNYRNTPYLLQPNDRVIIPYDEDQPQKRSSAWVHGAVELPGNYPVDEGSTTISDLLNMAGGLENEALGHAAYMIRKETSDRYVQPPTAFDPTRLTRSSNLMLEGFDYLELEKSLGHNRVGIDLTNSDKIKNTKVSDGDIVYIPKDYQSVVVFGQVNNPGYYSFKPQLSVREYIKKAEGFTVAADHEETYVIKAGSRAWKKPSETEVQSGDIIFVNRTPYQRFAEKRSQKNERLRLILTGVSTLTGFITTFLVLTR